MPPSVPSKTCKCKEIRCSYDSVFIAGKCRLCHHVSDFKKAVQ